jgi:hypothetical protein
VAIVSVGRNLDLELDEDRLPARQFRPRSTAARTLGIVQIACQFDLLFNITPSRVAAASLIQRTIDEGGVELRE